VADNPDTDKLVKHEPEGPRPDPITSRSTSGIVLLCALLLMAVLGWALYDEVYGQRGWKSVQQEFVSRYNRYLRRLKNTKDRNVEAGTEKEVKERPEYQALVAEVEDARRQVEPRTKEIDRDIRFIERQLAAISDPFQDKRGRITVVSYEVETADEDDKADLRRDVEELKNDPVEVEMPVSADSEQTREQKLNYAQLEERFNALKDQKARLLVEKADLLKPADEAAKRRDAFLKENVIGLSADQIEKLIAANNKFDYRIRQININGDQLVDRCETCHLGVRETFELTPANFRRGRRTDKLARAFVSHPTKELLTIHTPEKFGCSSCHWGNGRATTSEEKGHGRHKYWLHPMFRKENMEAGCQQCHAQDRVLDFAPQLTKGKDLFQERGCVGCHRFEGFDRETDGLASARQQIKQLEEQLLKNEIDAKQSVQTAGREDTAEERAQELLARATDLRVRNSQIEARIEQLNVQARYLMQDQKKVGPNLKDVRLKLRRDWIPEWLRDPQGFRPGTKMPTFWYLNPDHGMVKAMGRESDRQRADYERRAIAAYLWQNSFAGQLPKREAGNGAKGEELFKSVGCMACHSVGEGANKTGGSFAANLQRVGEKANFDYIVRWIYNPRERWAPYCPTEKRDLTREDYEKNGKPFVFDTHGHSKCPNDGAELQVQNMTVMPNFRLSEQDARDIATYLFSLGGQRNWPDASYMDSDQKLASDGFTAIKAYGCAGCHEIKGFEDEQRIGKELTTEGSTPIERLDFATLTHDAEKGIDPFTGTKNDVHGNRKGEWYTRKGFFEHKIEEPGIYDKGKEKDWRDHLRMPDPYIDMGEDGKNRAELDALTTFLLGSVGIEGSNVPASFFYNPSDRRKDIREGWWVVKKYNCMGCHTVQVGQPSVLSELAAYQTPEGKEQLPPALTTEGARVDPDWLLRFLTDPSLSGVSEETAAAVRNLAGRAQQQQDGPRVQPQAQPSPQGQPAQSGQQAGQQQGQQPHGQQNGQARGPETGAPLPPQPGANRNGVRTYLRARMPTFNFSPNELRTLVRFFMAVSSQQEPYIKPTLEPLSPQETNLARAIFTSQQAPCLKCHLTSPEEAGKNAPNFLQAGERLQPGWTFRWLLDPQKIIPGTAMPSELFKRDGERWVFAFDIPGLGDYKGDHADLLVRYMLQLTPQEQARIATSSPAAPSPTRDAPAATAYTPKGNEGGVVGTIAFNGTAPERKAISMDADNACAASNPNPLSEDAVVNDGKLQNVFVYVKDGKLAEGGRSITGFTFAPPSPDVVLDQKGCQYTPHVVGVMTTQQVRVLNSDQTTHNVNVQPKSNQGFNQAQGSGAAPIVKTFPRPEVQVPVKCNQHPWMKAYLNVMRHPFFAVSGADGRFEIKGLPPGTYTVAAWHERFGEKTQSITVGAGESKTQDFQFDAAAARNGSAPGSFEVLPAIEFPMLVHKH
jgi:cbb3-type cytochrome oxidase cytochrome c subunit/cytochrome c551/c552/plastocyanin